MSSTHDMHDELYNTIQRASFLRQEEDGAVFALKLEREEQELGDDELPELLIDAMEFNDERPLPSPTEEVEVLVERPWGKRYWSASYLKAQKLAMFDILTELASEKKNLRGVIVGSNRGGLIADVGVRGFIPWSQVDLHHVRDASPYIGKEEEFAVIDFDQEKCELVLSRERLLKQDLQRQARQTRERLEPGEVFDGVVRTVKPYGVFVDVGGVEGLLHVTNMSWARVDQPEELFRVGDAVRVVVLDYNAKKKRLSLGRKQLLADPWEEVEDRFSEGDVVNGKVVSLADYGAFVEIAPGLEGLVHVTELSWTDRVEHPSQVIEIGQEVGVKVLSVDPDGRRISLSIKQLADNPWEVFARSLEDGQVLSGQVRNVTDFGAFVEVERGIEGLVHVSNISWTQKGLDPAKFFTVGETIEVKVLSIDVEEQRLDLGIKQLTSDPWEAIEQIAKPGTKIPVTITRTADFGAFAQIREGIEGLIHVSELSPDRVENVLSVVRPGQQVDALVLSIDKGSQRISLSLKRDQIDEEVARSYSSDDDMATSTLGDILREQLGLGSEAQVSSEGGEEE